MKVVRAFRIANTNIVVRVLSGASCLCQKLYFENIKDIPVGIEVLSSKEAKNITGE